MATTYMNISGKDVCLRTSAFTKIIYRNLFGEDFTHELDQARGKNATQAKKINALEAFKKMAFVMVWQGRNPNAVDEIKNLSINDYYKWLDECDQSELENENFLASISSFWSSGKVTLADPKNQ